MRYAWECFVAYGCKKESEETPTPAAPTPTPTPAVTAAKSFTNLTFSPTMAYFSTNGTMTAPVDSNAAKVTATTAKIDITYFYNTDYSEPGFLDPVTRSQHWYWDNYYKSWLSSAVQTSYYSTDITKAEYDAAVSDQSKIATYFARTATVLAPHAIFPTGTCIGGRQTSSPTSVLLSAGAIFAFKNNASGKRGLIYINMSQGMAWPWGNNVTKVDIIREN
jgi:hypothetical protein